MIVDFYQENNTYVLEARHAFYGFSDDDTHDYYGSYEDAQNKTNKICTLGLLKENGIAKVPDGTECLTEENSKISRYLFQVENGKLYLAKYEVK